MAGPILPFRGIAISVILNDGNFIFNENDLDSGGLWADLDGIFMKYWVISLIDELLVVF